MSRSIIVPLDGSDRSERAIPWAVELARATGQSLTLMQVVPWPHTRQTEGIGATFSLDISERLRAELLTASKDYLHRLKATLDSRGLETHTESAIGDVVSTILDIADVRGASTIVLASHGHGGLTRLLIGSVAQQIAQQALVPTLIVRTGAGAALRASLKSVLIPMDGSTLAESALELANDILGSQSELVLARVVEPVVLPVDGAVDIGSVVDWQATEEASARAEKYLADHAQALERVGLKARTVVRTGRPESELPKIADEHNVHLIVMSTHGRTGFDRFMLGSVADALMRTAAQPVLLVSARALSAQLLEPYKVSDVMTANSASVREDEPLAVVASKLLRRRVSGAPVVNASGDLVGVISEHDLLDWHARYVAEMGRDESMLDPAAYRSRLGSDSAASIMTTPVIAVESDAPISAAVHLLLQHRLRRLPVTTEGRLAGAIARSDVLQALSIRDAQVVAATMQG